jgi:ribosomal protein L37AE/L43A
MSTIAAQCPSCGRKGNVPNQALGRQVKCPGCAATFTVTASNETTTPQTPPPAATSGSQSGQKQAAWFAQKEANGNGSASPPAAPQQSADGLMIAQCPCGFSGRVPERYRGKQVKCRQCGQMFTVGGEAPAPPQKAVTQSKPAGPATKVADAPTTKTDDIGLSPLEEEATAATVSEAAEAECEVIEVDVVADPECPVCGHQAKLPENYKEKQFRCSKCLTVFDLDGSAEDEAGEGAAPKKTGGSQAGTQKAAEVAAEEEAPAPSPWASLDQPEPRKKKKPRATAESDDEEAPRQPAFKRKKQTSEEEETARRQSAVTVVAASAGGLVLLAGGVALVAALMSGDKDNKPVAHAKTDPVVPKVVPSQAKAPPPTYPRPATRKLPVDPPPERKDPPKDPPPERKDPPPDPVDKPEPMPKEGEWVDVSERSCRFGNIRLRVTTVWIDDVRMLFRGEKAGVAEDVLVIQYEVENIADKGIVSFFGWGPQNAKPGEPVAVLTDNNGRVYRRLLLEAVEGQAEAKLLDPGKRASDRLLFGSPDEKAEFFRVELPAKNFNGDGTLRLQIPKSMIMPKVVRKDNDPVPREENKKLKELRTQLKSRLAPDRIRACDGIGALRGEGAPAVPDLIKLYATERDDNVKAAICEALQFIGPPAKAAVPTLLKALKDEFWRVRREAATALGVIGADPDQARQAIPLLKNMLKSKDEGVADAARAALTRLEAKK